MNTKTDHSNAKLIFVSHKKNYAMTNRFKTEKEEAKSIFSLLPTSATNRMLHFNDKQYIILCDSNNQLIGELYDVPKSSAIDAVNFVQVLSKEFGCIKGSYMQICIDLFGTTSYSDSDLDALLIKTN